MTPDLRTTYLGLDLDTPVVAGASPLNAHIEALCALEEAGAGAVVLPSLFEEQITHEALESYHLLVATDATHPEAAGYFPELDAYNEGPDAYVAHLARAKQELHIPVIASLNGSTPGGWVRYARYLEEAGADALELNVSHLPTDPSVGAAAVEERHVDVVRMAREAVTIPLAVKIGPHFSAIGNIGHRIVDAGADGLVLFNRFQMPDVDLDSFEVVPRVRLSDPDELGLPLQWIGVLHGRLKASLAASTGVHTASDVLKVLAVGADVAMATSAILLHGADHVQVMVDDITAWLTEHGYASVRQLVGSLAQVASPDPSAYERPQYMRALTSYQVVPKASA